MNRRLRALGCVALGAVAFAATLSAAAAASGPMSRAAVRARVQAMTELGRTLFYQPALSASGAMSCASCHSPAHAFGPPNDRPVQLGGGDMREPGQRAVPSLMYLQDVPQFTEHYFESEDEGDESIDNGPTGGLTWDGRVDSDQQQARIPLLSLFEMGGPTPAEVVARVQRAGYAPAFRAIFGGGLFGDTEAAFAAIGKVLEVYQQDYTLFYPYRSKYDAYLAGTAKLSAQEARGLALFEDPAKGNCAQCHISRPGFDGTPPQFTDYGFIALGAPRNPQIAANAVANYFDLGLCGPLRTDFRDRPDYCGLFLTPTLRNVATRHTFFHNGVFHTLREVVEFYATRDTDPAKWYPVGVDGKVRIFDDLPAAYRANINVDPPFGGKPGDRPRLDTHEIDDIIAFLGTLTDGYTH